MTGFHLNRKPCRSWWDDARRMDAEGVSLTEIAKALDVKIGSVSYAVRPEYRDRHRARALERYHERRDQQRLAAERQE